MDGSADLTVSAAGMPTGTSRDDLLIGLQRDRRGSANLVDEPGAKHCADVAAEDLVRGDEAFAWIVGAEVSHQDLPSSESPPRVTVHTALSPAASGRQLKGAQAFATAENPTVTVDTGHGAAASAQRATCRLRTRLYPLAKV